jgi:hypothetical protein
MTGARRLPNLAESPCSTVMRPAADNLNLEILKFNFMLNRKRPRDSYAILDAKLIVFILKKDFILIESKSSFKSK